MQYQRIIGQYTGTQNGPLLVCLGAMHGNELAGVRAIEILLRTLELESVAKADFEFRGSILGLCGNLKAIKAGQRYIQEDLNRIWEPERVERTLRKNRRECSPEEEEVKDILQCLEQEIRERKPERVVVLDLHTTSAEGGIFCIPTEDPESQRIALGLQAPVINGMLQGLSGTSLHYFGSQPFGEIPCVAVGFEAGQHSDRLSVSRAIAAMVNCLRSIGCIDDSQIDSQYHAILRQDASGLPERATLRYRHPIYPDDHFRMLPGFRNFDRVHKGQELARDIYGAILAEQDGYILMPLYQAQGVDGFFLVYD